MKGQRAIVVGASSGIGAAVATELGRRGAAVCLVAPFEDELEARREETRAALPEGTPEPIHRVHDVRGEDVEQAFKEIVEALGGLDLLVYTAGVMPDVGPEELDSEKDAEMFAVNTVGLVRWMNAGARYMQAKGHGALVAISSVAGDRGRRGNPAYCSSKAAASTFMESLRNRLAVRGIGVVTVKPGFVDTQMTRGKEGIFWLVSPEFVARRIVKAVERGEGVVYVPARWRLVMLIIRHIPSFLFRRMSI